MGVRVRKWAGGQRVLRRSVGSVDMKRIQAWNTSVVKRAARRGTLTSWADELRPIDRNLKRRCQVTSYHASVQHAKVVWHRKQTLRDGLLWTRRKESADGFEFEREP